MKFLIPILVFFFAYEVTPALAIKNNDEQTIVPIIFHDPLTKNYIYIESDGRHVAAFTPDGVLLWHCNPFLDLHLKSYRFTNPVICSVERSKSVRGILLKFNSTQMVSLDDKTGAAMFLGQR